MEDQEATTGPAVMVGSWMSPELKAQLEELAKTNERSVSGEIRRAVVKHLAAESPEGS